MNPIDERVLYHKYLFSKSIVDELRKNKFLNDSYTDTNDIILICSIIEKYLIDSFITIVERFVVSFDDVLYIIQIYSANPNPTSKKMFSFRQTCRYIFYLLPSLKLTSNKSPNSDLYNMDEFCKLIALNNLIQEINQAYGLQSLAEQSCIEINLSKYFVINYTDPFILRLNNLLSNSSHIIEKSFYSEDILNRLLKTLDENSQNIKRIFDYTTDLWSKQADVFEITNETVGVTDSIIGGLLFDYDNVNLFKAIDKPLNPHYRTRFRPFLCLNLDGNKRTFTTTWFIREALEEISMNLMPYGELPIEWRNVPQLTELAKSVQKELGNLFEKEVANLIKNKYITKNNISGFNHVSLKDQIVPNTKRTVGQIDVISIDTNNKTIYVIDAKCTKTKYFFQTFLGDKQTYNQYNIKLQDKVNWVSEHKDIVAQYFKLPSFEDYKVEGLFVSNSLIYFGFFSPTPIIPLDKLLRYLEIKDIKCLVE